MRKRLTGERRERGGRGKGAGRPPCWFVYAEPLARGAARPPRCRPDRTASARSRRPRTRSGGRFLRSRRWLGWARLAADSRPLASGARSLHRVLPSAQIKAAVPWHWFPGHPETPSRPSAPLPTPFAAAREQEPEPGRRSCARSPHAPLPAGAGDRCRVPSRWVRVVSQRTGLG